MCFLEYEFWHPWIRNYLLGHQVALLFNLPEISLQKLVSLVGIFMA